MINLLAVAAGGAIGSVLRYSAVHAVSLTGISFPAGTLLVNTAGSFVIGVLAAVWMIGGEPPQVTRLFFQTGLLGSFTTFSAFSLDTLLLWQNGQPYVALLNTLLNVSLCLLSVTAGMAMIGFLQR